jgi:integrase/recombinase XerD
MIRKSGVAAEGSCHLFRHAMATAMHDAGADIRFVQEMLGHVKLDTTQIYTRVSIENIQGRSLADPSRLRVKCRSTTT